MCIVVADAPPLKDDDGHQDQQHHHDGDAQANCYYKRCIHIVSKFAAKLQSASKTDVSLAEKYVSNLEFLLLTSKKTAAEAPFGVSAAVASRYGGELVL